MRTSILVFTAILFFLRATAGCYIEELEYTLQSDDGFPHGFYPIKDLEEFLSPYIEKGSSKGIGVAPKQMKKLGQGANGATYRIQWPGYENGAIAKINKKEHIARHEATILAYLDGAAGAPRLLSYQSRTGYMVMESVGSSNIHILRKMGLSTKRMLMAFMTLTRSLNDLHNQGVVHGDLKPNNVMVSFDALGFIRIHFIDFGMSTLSGHRGGLVIRKQDWMDHLKRRPWYSAEFYKGRILDNRSDFPGLAYIMRRLMPKMETECQRLFQLTGRAMAYDRDSRPFLEEFLEVLL